VRRSSVIAVLFGVGMSSCAGDKSPREQCQDLVSVICGRAVGCIAGAAGRKAECIDALEPIAGCERVDQPSAMYESCVDRVESETCSALFSNSTSMSIMVVLPAECNDVVDLQTSP
jgi:hypothetical protein